MKIYLVVEYKDHGAEYAIEHIIKAFTQKKLAEDLKDKLNLEDKNLYSTEELTYLTYFPPFCVEEIELDVE